MGSDNSLSPSRRQAIIWTNAGTLLIEPLGTNFKEILIEIHIFSFKNIHLKMSSRKWSPFVLASMCWPLSSNKSTFWKSSLNNSCSVTLTYRKCFFHCFHFFSIYTHIHTYLNISYLIFYLFYLHISNSAFLCQVPLCSFFPKSSLTLFYHTLWTKWFGLVHSFQFIFPSHYMLEYLLLGICMIIFNLKHLSHTIYAIMQSMTQTSCNIWTLCCWTLIKDAFLTCICNFIACFVTHVK